MNNCIYLGWGIGIQKHVCLLGNLWPCTTDATVCGDYEQEAQLYEWM